MFARTEWILCTSLLVYSVKCLPERNGFYVYFICGPRRCSLNGNFKVPTVNLRLPISWLILQVLHEVFHLYLECECANGPQERCQLFGDLKMLDRI